MKKCETIIKKALTEKRTSLLATEAQQICNLHNIPTPKSQLTKKAQEAATKATEIGFPVALKILSPNIIHKTEAGGVALNINNEKELKSQYKSMISKVIKREPTAKILGVMIQKMMPATTEVIVGAIRDSQFGPTIMFGMGGIYTEIYSDVAFRVAPIDKVDADNLITGIKGAKILQGARGKPPADTEALTNLLINVSNLITLHENIIQLDLNPVLTYPDGVCAVDTRIIINPPSEDHQ